MSNKKMDDVLNDLREKESKNQLKNKKKVKRNDIDELTEVNALSESELKNSTEKFKVKLKRYFGLDKGIINFLITRLLPALFLIVVSFNLAKNMGYQEAKKKYATPEITEIISEKPFSEVVDNLRKDELSAMQKQLSDFSESSKNIEDVSIKDSIVAISNSNKEASKTINAFFDKTSDLKNTDSNALNAFNLSAEELMSKESYEENIKPQLKNLPSVKIKKDIVKISNTEVSLISSNEGKIKNYMALYYFTIDEKIYLSVNTVATNDSYKVVDFNPIGYFETEDDNMFKHNEEVLNLTNTQ